MNLADPERLNSSVCIFLRWFGPSTALSSHKAWFIFSQVFITCKWNSICFYCRVEIKTHFTHTDRIGVSSPKDTDLVHKLPIKSCCSNLTHPTESLYVGYVINSVRNHLFIKGQYYEGVFCSYIFNFMLALSKVLLHLSFQLLQQLKRLICDLCRLYNLPQHPDVEMLDQPLPAAPLNQDRKVSVIHEQSLSKLQTKARSWTQSNLMKVFLWPIKPWPDDVNTQLL